MRRAEEPGVTGYPAEREGIFVVHFADEMSSSPRIDLRRRDARTNLDRRYVSCLQHAERREDVAREIPVEASRRSTRSTISPMRIAPMSLYTMRTPGSVSSGVAMQSSRIESATPPPCSAGLHAGRPLWCVIRCRTVTFSLLAPVHSGRYFCTGASRSTLSVSTSCIIADVIPTTLVSDAMSHNVESVGRGDGAQSRWPAVTVTMGPE